MCQSDHAGTIDKALFNRISYAKIVERYGRHFPEPYPLTIQCLFNHWKHVREAVGETVAGIIPLPKGVLNPNLGIATPAQQQIFEELVTAELDEIATLRLLAESGLKDLERLETDADLEALEEVNRKVVRSKVRVDTAKIVGESAKVKKMASTVDEDRARLEKGRIVFRLFEIMKNALDAVPQDIRALVSARLKDGLRRDDEILAMLQTQGDTSKLLSPPVEAPNEAKVVDGAPAAEPPDEN